MVLSSCCSSIARVHPVHAESAARRQVAADLWTKPIGLNHKPACRLPVNYTHHRHSSVNDQSCIGHLCLMPSISCHPVGILQRQLVSEY